MVWATHADLDDAARAAVDRLLATEPPRPATEGWAPTVAAGLLAATGATAVLTGPSFVMAEPPRPRAGAGARICTSADTPLPGLAPLLPEHDRGLCAPWAVALVDGLPAAVCETARATPDAVEAGVWTYPPYRRRGLATAVTAVWSGMHGPRTVFYSCAADNPASQAVARHLGFCRLAHWWQAAPTLAG